MIKTVLFDLDETLFDFKSDERAALKSTLLSLGIKTDDAVLSLYSRINLEQWKRLEKREITRDQVKFNRYKLFFEALGVNSDPNLANELYEGKLSEQGRLLPGAKQTLERLYGSFRLFIVSNGTEQVQRGRLKNTGIEIFFEKAFFSEQIGFEKPDIRFFDACFSSIPDFDRKSTVIVGDSLSSDIAGGRMAGITTLWINSGSQTSNLPNMEVNNLEQAADLIFSLKTKSL